MIAKQKEELRQARLSSLQKKMQFYWDALEVLRAEYRWLGNTMRPERQAEMRFKESVFAELEETERELLCPGTMVPWQNGGCNACSD
jgi:hypothetical protein